MENTFLQVMHCSVSLNCVQNSILNKNFQFILHLDTFHNWYNDWKTNIAGFHPTAHCGFSLAFLVNFRCY